MIKSLQKEYLLEFSKLKTDFDFSELKENLIMLKEKYMVYKKHKKFLNYLSNEKINITLYLDDNLSIKVAKKDMYLLEVEYIVCNDYTINNSDILLNFLENSISLNSLVNSFEKQCLDQINRIIMEFNKNLLIKDASFWINFFAENRYLLKIINIEDFYQLIGNSLTFQDNAYTTSYMKKLNVINELISIFHIKWTYLECEEYKELIALRKNDLNKLATLISRNVIKSKNKISDGIGLFIAYALTNKLLSIEETINLLDLNDAYYTDFLLTEFEMPSEEFNRIFYKELKTSVIYISKNIQAFERLKIIKNDLCIYNLLIPTKYYTDNQIAILLKIATMLKNNNRLVFSLVFPKYYHFDDYHYIDDEIIKKDLNDNIEALTDILKIPIIEMKKLIETNILA
jgi:hypothetical protein